MRRNEKEIRDIDTIHRILEEADVCRVGFCMDNKPYIVPMNFGFDDNCLYLHSAHEGQKMEILSENKNICFEVDIHTKLKRSKKPCNWDMSYISVIGSGIAEVIEEPEEKIKALDKIMNKYDDTSFKSYEYSESSLNKTAVIKVVLEKLTGKKSG